MKPGFGAPGAIDYRLSRKQIVDAYRAGELARHEVCDAQPELRRAAAHTGRETETECPICEEHAVVVVRYVFGPRLPNHGRCITSERELRELSRRRGEFTCYDVEVCPACAWNHLLRVRTLGTGRGEQRAAQQG
jgi:hypothetical protein